MLTQIFQCHSLFMMNFADEFCFSLGLWTMRTGWKKWERATLQTTDSEATQATRQNRAPLIFHVKKITLIVTSPILGFRFLRHLSRHKFIGQASFHSSPVFLCRMTQRTLWNVSRGRGGDSARATSKEKQYWLARCQ